MDIQIQYIDEIRCKLICDREILLEIKDHFSFFAKGYLYHPLYKAGRWDGKISMLDLGTKLFYNGLVTQLARWCKDNEYKVKIENIDAYKKVTIDEELLAEIFKTTDLTPHDYQVASVREALMRKKCIVISPTGCWDKNEKMTFYIDDHRTTIPISTLPILLADGKEVYINTYTGLSRITDTYIKTGTGRLLEFADHTMMCCHDKHMIRGNDGDYIAADTLNVGDSISGNTLISITETENREWIDFSIEANHETYFHKGFEHHNSGKSLISYFLFRYCIAKEIPLLITVPSTSLVEQLYSDFVSYVNDDLDIAEYVDVLYSGKKTKDSEKICLISTWQSVCNLEAEWFDRYMMYLCDECHSANSAELSKIIDKLNYCDYRIGLTGTLNGTYLHELEMRARFGTVFTMVTTRELIERGQLAEIDIRCIVLNYTKEERKEFKRTVKTDYIKEIAYILKHERRKQYVIDLALEQTENTLMLFNSIEGYGNELHERLCENDIENLKNVYFITGKVKATAREVIRNAMDGAKPIFYDLVTDSGYVRVRKQWCDSMGMSIDTLTNTDISLLELEEHYTNGNPTGTINSIVEHVGSSILFATYGTLAIGINIKNLHVLIFCQPYKARIRNLQSIGRILRTANDKNIVYLYDICDDLKTGKKPNHTYKHFTERLSIYEEVEFNYSIINKDL